MSRSTLIIMDQFYFVMVWVLFALLTLCVIMLSVFIYIYVVRNTYLRNKIDYLHTLFDDHFKTTDATIEDLRKERDELKKKLT